MLYPTATFEPDDRDIDGYYMIGSGHQHIFTFTVPYMGLQSVKIAHVMPGSQDWSIDFYFSESSMGPALFTDENATGHYRVGRIEKQIDIWSEGSEEESDYYLEPGRTYYMMVRNLQNQNNGYKLLYSV